MADSRTIVSKPVSDAATYKNVRRRQASAIPGIVPTVPAIVHGSIFCQCVTCCGQCLEQISDTDELCRDCERNGHVGPSYGY